MTTADIFAKDPKPAEPFRLPDPPEEPEDKMTSFDHLAANGNAHHLAMHFGNPETTLVTGDRYLVVSPTRSLAGSRYPDLLVAFGVYPALYEASNGYIIAEQGKPPDFVLEIASARTGEVDTRDKPQDYAALGIPEYWRFDATGRYHGARLAADRLEHDRYVPIPIEQLADDILQGHSRVLNLNIRWEQGRLGWYDPATGQHILTYDDQRARADGELQARLQEREARLQEQDARLQEREARLQAEARVRELEEELQRLRNG